MSKQKFRKSYLIHLDLAPYYDQNGRLTYHQHYPYSRVYLTPHQSPPRNQLLVAVPELLMGYRRYSYFLIYEQAQIDHDHKTVLYRLRGITTIPGWRTLARNAPRDDYHTPGLNWRYYYYFSKRPRVPRVVRAMVRKTILNYGAELRTQPVSQLIKDCLSGTLNQEVERRLSLALPQHQSLLKNGYTFEVRPRSRGGRDTTPVTPHVSAS